ncbi:MAG: hypothetical protein ABIJ39_09615, partial [Chloroflexota bacterium]
PGGCPHAVQLIYNVFTSVASLRHWTAWTGQSGRHGPDSVDDFTGLRTEPYLRYLRKKYGDIYGI